MDNTQKLLTEILKCAFWGKDAELTAGIDWRQLYIETCYHRMNPFVYEALAKLQADHPEYTAFVEQGFFEAIKRNTILSMIKNKSALQKQRDVLKVLQEAGVKACVIKGTSLSRNYPKPDLRVLGDLDLYVRPEEVKHAGEAIETLGYEYEKTTTLYHTAFVKEGYEIEIHNSFAGMPSGETAARMKHLKDLCERGVVAEDKDGSFLMPRPVDSAIIQLLHILHHTGQKGMTLRLVCDWMMFVDKNVSDDVWEKDFKELFDDINLTGMAKLLTKMCKVYLGLDNPAITWCDDCDEKKCVPFWEYILTHDKEEDHPEKKEVEMKMRDNEWEYKTSGGKLYICAAVIRNIKKLVRGERKLSDLINIVNDKSRLRKKFVALNLFNGKAVHDYCI